ncbi:MAG: TetR/AcrR family transcriptional regulator [Rhizomicrobium sp.]
MKTRGQAAALQTDEPEESAGDRSRREILDAAARFLRSHGYHATTLRDIAGAVGIKAGSIYYHFASKDEIVAAVMNDGVDSVFDAVQAALRALPKTADPRRKLEAAIRAHLHALLDRSDYTSAGLKAYSDAPEAVRQAARPHRRRYEAVWDGLVRELVQADLTPRGVSREAIRLAVLGLMNWSPEWYRPRRHSIETLAGEFAAILLRAERMPVRPRPTAAQRS